MKTVIVDHRISPECEKNLLLRGFLPISLPKSKDMTEAISSHPDSLLFKYESTVISTADYCEEALPALSALREACDVTLRFTSDTLGKGFPDDAKMNALVMGKKVFCNAKTVSRAIIDLATDEGLEIIHVNQAYPRCATLALGDDFAITADKGLATALKDNGIEVMLISEDGISLPPYKYGFIGGASGVFSDKVYFFGDYHTHPDGEIIEAAILGRGYTPISLSGSGLVDLGGMLFFD